MLKRRRLTTTLGVGAYNLLEAPRATRSAPELSFRARLRYDADYGVSSAETATPPRFGTFVPGLQTQRRVDLMYGYVEGRRFFRGLARLQARPAVRDRRRSAGGRSTAAR